MGGGGGETRAASGQATGARGCRGEGPRARCSFPRRSCGMFMSISSTRCRRPRARSSSASRARLTPSRAATSSRSHACTSCVPAPQRPRSLPRPRLAAAALLVWRRTTLLRTARLRHERGRCAEDAGHDTRVRSMQAMLRADNIAYSMSAVRGIDDIKEYMKFY